MSKNTNYLSVVQGNDFVLNINVSKRNADNAAYSPYDMTACSQVCCFLVAVTGGRRYKLPVTVDGNVLTADIDGSMLNVGVYGLELLFEDAQSHSKRSYEAALLKIVRTNAEATYTQADFDSEDDCRLHLTIQTNSSFITVGAPTADTQIDATSYNAISNFAVADAINNLQSQIDTIGSEILDPASVYTKDETEALIDTMVDPQEMADYVTNAVSYYTTTEQFDSSYNSLDTRISYIEDNPVDLSSYVSKDFLSQQGYITAGDVTSMGYITAQDVSSMGYATQAYVDEKVAAVDVTDQLTDYVRKEDLNNAGYLQSDDLNGLATESYVVDKINAIAPTDISGLVSYEFLTSQAYLQADDISDVVRDSDLVSAGYITESDVSQMGYVTAQDVSSMGYATTQFVTQQIANIPEPDLSAYVTDTELTNTLSSYAQLSDLIANERVVSTALNSLADRIETVEGDYVSDDELDEALLPYATEAYVVEKIDALSPSDLNEYVSKEYLSQQAYLQADDLTDYATKSYVTTYVTEQVAADLTDYVSKSELNAASYLQSDDLNGYATESYVAEKIDSISPADLTEYVSKQYLSQQSYLQAADLNGYATQAYVTEQIAAIPEPDMSAYVTKTELNTASYLQADDLNDYATKTYVTTYVTDTVAADLSAYASKEYLSQQAYLQSDDLNGYATEAYVTEQIAAIPDPDMSAYVTKTELNTASYLQADDLTDYATKSYVTTYVTDTVAADLTAYASKEYLSQQAYITATDLSNASYVTTTALNTALSSYAKVSDIEDNEQVISTALNTLSDRIGLIENDYVSDDDLDDALSAYATKSYVDEKISGITPTDLSAYVSKTELNAAGYITANDVSAMGYVTESDLSDYVTDSDLASASYVTNTALNTTLASYVTTTDVPYKFVVLSYAQYTALATKDQNTIYMIPEE